MSLRIAQDGHARAHPAVYTEGGQAAVGNVGGNITEAQLEDSIWQACMHQRVTLLLTEPSVYFPAMGLSHQSRLLWMSTLLAFASTGLPAAVSGEPTWLPDD